MIVVVDAMKSTELTHSVSSVKEFWDGLLK